MRNIALRIWLAAMIASLASCSGALAESNRQAVQTSNAPATSVAPLAKLSEIPTCDEARDKYRELVGSLPDDYPAMHFDKEQLIKTMVDIASTPNITMDELAKIFGLKFVACTRPDFDHLKQAISHEVRYFSNGGFPLKPIREKYGVSVSISGDLNDPTRRHRDRLLFFYFDFNGDKAKIKPKMDVMNCVMESDFHEHLKDKWELNVLYGHTGYKHYTREIDGLRVQFRASPFLQPDPKRDTRFTIHGLPICIFSISVLIQAK